MEPLSSMGPIIAAKRKEHRLRQTDLAAAAGLSRATIDALENGRASDIGFSKLSRILAVFGLELHIGPANNRPTLDELLKEDVDD